MTTNPPEVDPIQPAQKGWRTIIKEGQEVVVKVMETYQEAAARIAQGKPVPVVGPPPGLALTKAIVQRPVEVERVEAPKTVVAKSCWCGRELRHRGRHRGQPKRPDRVGWVKPVETPAEVVKHTRKRTVTTTHEETVEVTKHTPAPPPVVASPSKPLLSFLPADPADAVAAFVNRTLDWHINPSYWTDEQRENYSDEYIQNIGYALAKQITDYRQAKGIADRWLNFWLDGDDGNRVLLDVEQVGDDVVASQRETLTKLWSAVHSAILEAIQATEASCKKW